jgi:alcohol dehydrogenase class IV
MRTGNIVGSPALSAIRFEFATATRILFGAGTLSEAAPAAAQFGPKVVLVRGNQPGRTLGLEEALRSRGLSLQSESVSGEPTVEWLRAAAERRRPDEVSAVIACGGGSVIDAGKALAAMLANPGDPLDYLEVIGQGQPLPHPALPFIAIPTTAGTGAEVTRNAVLGSTEHRLKASLRSAGMLPKLAVVDPELAISLPANLTAYTGLDALTQLIEPFVCQRANPLTDALCREGITRVARSLRRACEAPQDLTARTEMALASLLSGLALANAGLGVVHGLAAPIGGMFPAPHGAVCAALLPHAMRVNLQALREREPASPALLRFQEISVLLTGCQGAAAADGVEWVASTCHFLGVPPLSHWGVEPEAIPTLAERARHASSMKANPISLFPQELEALLADAL